MQDYSTCDIADALLRLSLPCPVFPLKSLHNQRLYGPIYPIGYSTSPHPPIPPPIDSLPSDHIAFLSVPSVGCASIGGLIASRVISLRGAGIITTGNIRDISELPLTLPIFYSGISPRSAKGMLFACSVGVIHVMVEGRDVEIRQGDIVVGDEHGVVIVPQDKVRDVVEMCAVITREDGECLRAVREGSSLKDAFSKYRSK